MSIARNVSNVRHSFEEEKNDRIMPQYYGLCYNW